MSGKTDSVLEEQIGLWRGYVERRNAVSAADVDEMEDHLRDQISELSGVGLESDEAFLVAVKRMGSVDGIAREFAREHSERLWKQLVLVPDDTDAEGGASRRELWVVLIFALATAVTLKTAAWLMHWDEAFVRNLALYILPFLTGYFAWKRRLSVRRIAVLAVPFAVAAVLLNVYPFGDQHTTEVIAAIHTPVVLWVVVGLAYVGEEWRSHRRRMDFVRFTGEWVIYMFLLALGGGVLTGLTSAAFETLDLNGETLIVEWLVPMCAAGAVIVAAWLVEAKQNVVENIAPVLTRVFTPLTILMLVLLLGGFAAAGSVIDAERELLILMDGVLILVLGLLLYSLSARDPLRPADFFDRLQLPLVGLALVIDLLMLTAMVGRIAEFGVSPNKTVALGLNLLLLVNLSWAAWLLWGFVRGQRGFADTERWQTRYLPIFGVWAAVVVVFVPPLFGFE